MKRILPVVTAFAAIGCLSAAPALASQPSAAHPTAVAAAHPGHAVAAPGIALTGGCTAQQPCTLADAAGTNFTWQGVLPSFNTPVIGHVGQNNTCWPFSNCGFDVGPRSYNGREVLEFKATNYGNYCMQTDSVHTHVSLEPCVAHDAGDYWVGVGNGDGRGICSANAIWLVNVGETNHYSPNIEAMYFNSAAKGEYVDSGLPISDDDQWCVRF